MKKFYLFFCFVSLMFSSFLYAEKKCSYAGSDFYGKNPPRCICTVTDENGTVLYEQISIDKGTPGFIDKCLAGKLRKFKKVSIPQGNSGDVQY